MLDIKLIRNEPDMVRAALGRRGPHAVAALDTLLKLDVTRRLFSGSGGRGWGRTGLGVAGVGLSG